MKLARPTDEFELKNCLKGLGLFLIFAHSHTYDFCHHLTFKKSLKKLAHEFKDPYDEVITDLEFFRDIDDPIVRHAHWITDLLVRYCNAYSLTNGLDQYELLACDDRMESNRYAPRWHEFTFKGSYLKTTLAYERFLDELSNSFYYYCCAISLESYQIPLKMKTRLDYSFEGSYKYLNVENYEVNRMISLIDELQKQHQLLKQLMKNS